MPEMDAFTVNASTLSGKSKQITGIRCDSTLEQLCSVLAKEFEMPELEVKLCKGTQVFTSSNLSATLDTLGIEQGANLSVLRDPLPNGVYMFNSSTKAGVEFLKQHGWSEPRMLAEIFERAELGFNKCVLGEYLVQDHVACKSQSSDESVLHHMIRRQDFCGQELNEAMRSFFTIFYAPRPSGGPGAPMDVFVELFAQKYYSDNPGVFASADCVYRLTYSLLWLYNDTWSEEKFEIDFWMLMNSGINNGADLPYDYLKKLYTTAQSNPCPIFLCAPRNCAGGEAAPNHHSLQSLWNFVKWPPTTGLLMSAELYAGTIKKLSKICHGRHQLWNLLNCRHEIWNLLNCRHRRVSTKNVSRCF